MRPNRARRRINWTARMPQSHPKTTLGSAQVPQSQTVAMVSEHGTQVSSPLLLNSNTVSPTFQALSDVLTGIYKVAWSPQPPI